MHRLLRPTLGLAALLVVAACSTSDQPRQIQSPTEPSFTKGGGGGSCTTQAYNDLVTEATALFDGTVETSALDQLKDIKQKCGTTNGKQLGITYLGFVLTNKGISNTTIGAPPGTIPAADNTRAHDVAAHMTHLIAYDALGSDIVPWESLLIGGAAAVIPNEGGSLVACSALPCSQGTPPTEGNFLAGLIQQDLTTPDGDHLYTIYRDPTISCLPTSLPRTGATSAPHAPTPYCYVFGAVGRTPSKGFNPNLVLFICTEDQSGADVLDVNVTLGHKKSNGAVEALTRDLSATPGSYACSHEPPPSLAYMSPLKGAFSKYFALAMSPFRPTKAYAVNGGLGISDDFNDGMSPIGDVSRQTFFADFFGETPGSPPSAQPAGMAGSWTTIFANAPASISLENSFGGMNTVPPFVVLNQGQGACNNCPTLTFEGTLATNASNPTAVANLGTYVVTFTSMQHKPSVKAAPMYLLASDGTVITSLSYSTESSVRRLRFGNKPVTRNNQNDIVGTWNVDAPETFTMTVTFNAAGTGGTVTLSGSLGTSGSMNFTAPDLSKISWIFNGIDAGALAIDDINSVRSGR